VDRVVENGRIDAGAEPTFETATTQPGQFGGGSNGTALSIKPLTRETGLENARQEWDNRRVEKEQAG
jgi:hypothetical protein